MRRIHLLLFSFIVVFAGILQAQAPKNPELKKLAMLPGRWEFQCDMQAGPLGPAGQASGEAVISPILGGFFYQVDLTLKAGGAVVHVREIEGYDPVAKKFTFANFADNGNLESGTFSFNGRVATVEGRLSAGGKQYLTRRTITWAPDWTRNTWKAEISTDGKSWMPWFEQRTAKLPRKVKK